MSNDVKKVLNIGGGAEVEYQEWLDTYKERALDNCNSRLEDNVKDIYNIVFNFNNIEMQNLQWNYLLCEFASIISKLTTNSNSYDFDTIISIKKLIKLYLDYLAKLKKEYILDLDELQYATYTAAAVDSIVKPGSFTQEQDVKNLYDFSKLLVDKKVESFKYDDDRDPSLNKDLSSIAENPFGFDIFAFGIRRHDKLFNLLEAQYKQDQLKGPKKM